MDEPVTRRELHEALETWAGAIISKLSSEMAAQLAAQGAELHAGLEAQRSETRALLDASENAIIDRMEAMLDPHATVPARVRSLEAERLPERVSRLEAKVFAPKRRASKTARRKRR